MEDEYKKLLREILGKRIVAYYPSLAGIIGGVKSAILLSQLLYYDSRQENPGEWFSAKVKTISQHTGLTTKEQATARRELVKHKVLEVEKRGMPARYEYRVDLDHLAVIVAGKEHDSATDSDDEQSFVPHKSLPMGDSRVTEEETLESTNGQLIKESLKNPLKKKKEDSSSSDQTPWVQALAIIQRKISKHHFETWWRDTWVVGIKDGRIKIGVCNQFAAEVLNEAKDIAEDAVEKAVGKRYEIEFVMEKMNG